MFKRLRRALYLSAFIGWVLFGALLQASSVRPPAKDCRDIQTLLGQMPAEAEDLFVTVRQQAEAWGEAHKREPDIGLAAQLSQQTRDAARLYLRPDIAESFDQMFFFHQFEILIELFAKLFFPVDQETHHVLPTVNSVLVLGTGTAIDIEALSAVLPLRSGHTRVLGVDYSKAMLRRAAERIQRLRLSSSVKLLWRDLLETPDVITEQHMARSLNTTPGTVRADLIISMACLGQYFDHRETVRIIRDWIAPYLKVGGKLGFVVASKDELAFPHVEFSEDSLADHPWVKMMAHYGIVLRGMVPVRGKTQPKYFLMFERERDHVSRGVVEADADTLRRLAELARTRPPRERDPAKTVFPDEEYRRLRDQK